MYFYFSKAAKEKSDQSQVSTIQELGESRVLEPL